MLAALSHPERIERFVAMSIPHPWQRERSALDIASSAWYQVVLAAPVVGKLAIGRLGFPRLVLRARAREGLHSRQEELDTYMDVLKQPDATEASMRMYRDFLLHELVPAATGGYKEEQLTVPTRWIVGEEDQVSGKADDGYLRSRRRHDARAARRASATSCRRKCRSWCASECSISCQRMLPERSDRRRATRSPPISAAHGVT